ncbi:MAG: glycine--tRNA ligase [Eubacterium sp.]|nr:glycine--tRNA ligase [Eubacterium sp.]
MEKTMEKIVALCKSRGFIYPGSEIYGGLANSWDYGNLGVELKNNVKQAWWKKFIQENKYNVGVDCAILMNPQTWVASGHLGSFSDPLMDCKECHARFRADQLIEDYMAENDITPEKGLDGWTHEEMADYIKENNIVCPTCGKQDFTDIREFNLMFKTFQGVTEEASDTLYMRPETAQGIFVNFANVQRTSRKKIPFGIGQIGKAFRNEITPGNFTFRTREFEQMELEFFCEPGTDLEWFEYWRGFCKDWLLNLGIKEEEMRLRDHDKEELSFYSNATTDIEFLFPFGWGELWGIADRTDYDLNRHIETSGKDLTYFDDEKHERYVPYVIEPSLGADRVTLAFLCAAYDEENIGTEEKPDMRTVMHFHPAIAPVKVGVLPLSKKLNEGATKVFDELSKYYNCEYDDRGAIGKRYRRQDEIGTPYCITYDFDSEEDGAVTVRDRDTMEQERIKIEDLKDYLEEKLAY